jgi:hypothetical protein
MHSDQPSSMALLVHASCHEVDKTLKIWHVGLIKAVEGRMVCPWRALLLGIFLSTCSGDFNGKSFSGNLETALDEAIPCVRLYYNKGAIGCRTPHDKATGAFYEIRNENDLNSIKDIAVDFVILTPAQYFNQDLLKIFAKHHKQPKGVVVYDENWIPQSDSSGLYSTDMNTTQGVGTPQSDLSFNRKYSWNNYGNGMMYEDLPFPIVRASNNDINFLQRLSSENRDYGMSGSRVNVGEFRYYMGKEDITSGDCLSWKDSYGDRHPQCLPIGGLSIWGSADVLVGLPCFSLSPPAS